MIDLRLGDCIEVLKTLEDNSVDSIVTDPPYGLSILGKKWDYNVPSVEIWRECLRVLKPGGHLLSFGGSRTYHRMTVAIEDAGFEIRDQIMWIYSSGFPKSHNIGKKVEGYEGWGTALKPAHEPICMARKPLSEKSIADNVLKHGTGGINIDDSRIEYTEEDKQKINFDRARVRPNQEEYFGNELGYNYFTNEDVKEYNIKGRFPANIMFNDDTDENWKKFFFCPKSSKKEKGNFNNHPTVKPIKLMEYLITLVTPKGGIVMDCFMGSGSTGVAAKNLGFSFIGVEREQEYFDIGQQRINQSTQTKLDI
jgi:site-specific DNA-methyltransferase (adenine-specific)